MALRPEASAGVKSIKFKVILHDAEEGGYWASVPSLPGCFNQGETLEETLENIREAIECYLDTPDLAAPIGPINCS